MSGLTIGQLADRTGVPVATLRTWESRYGVPRPRRQDGGHRRYDPADVVLVQDIVRLRDSGLALSAAVTRAQAVAAEPDPSLFALLRTRFPSLPTRTLRKASLLTLTRAIEDECCAGGGRPLLFGAFQRERYYRASAERWAELARTSAGAVVFADFAESSSTDENPVRVGLRADAPLLREWALVCDGPDSPACVTGWELPGQRDTPEPQRTFECLWTVDPHVVREAARACARIAGALGPQVGERFAGRLADTPPDASADLARSQRLFDRVVWYFDAGR
jgi:DNA-binding transcriptional MerR regulator